MQKGLSPLFVFASAKTNSHLSPKKLYRVADAFLPSPAGKGDHKVVDEEGVSDRINRFSSSVARWRAIFSAGEGKKRTNP